MDNYIAELHQAGAEKVSVKVDKDLGIDKHLAAELLQGRSVNKHGAVWLVGDFNDKDAKGNIKIREINIPDYNPMRELQGLPLKRMSALEKQQLSDDLSKGKKVMVKLTVNGKTKQVALEAAPLKRGFSIYDNGKKVSLKQLKDKTIKHSDFDKMKVIKSEEKKRVTPGLGV